MSAAETQKSQATVSFEALSRQIQDFPKRILTDARYYVDQWAEGVTAESWFYSNQGTSNVYSGTPILFAELLECMLPKFLARIEKMGFSSCQRDAGTWKVTAVWGATEKEEERPAKRARAASLVGGA